MTTTAMQSNPIQLTAKLYDARGAMRSLFGDNYPDKVKLIIDQLRVLSVAWDLSPIKTMLKACDEIKKRGASGVDLAIVIAAYVEDVEGTFNE